MSSYAEVYAAWQKDPEAFWAQAAKAVDWIDAPKKIFDATQGPYGRWFPDATCNTCYNVLDRHVKNGRADQTAIIYDSPVANTKRKLTYAQVLDEVSALAAVLQDFGVQKGDRVIVYMPMIPEALIGMYACARIGAIHSVVFGGFAAKELATRIDDAKPKLVLAASCGIEPGRVVAYKPLLDEAIHLSSSKPDNVILFAREQAKAEMVVGRDHDWTSLVELPDSRQARGMCAGESHRSALYSLHIRHDRYSQGCGA